MTDLEDVVDFRRNTSVNCKRVTFSVDDLRQKQTLSRRNQNRLGSFSGSSDSSSRALRSSGFSGRETPESCKTSKKPTWPNRSAEPETAQSGNKRVVKCRPETHQNASVSLPVAFEISATDDRAGSVRIGASSRAQSGRHSAIPDQEYGRGSSERPGTIQGSTAPQELTVVDIQDDDCELCRWADLYYEIRKRQRPCVISEQCKLLDKYLRELQRDF